MRSNPLVKVVALEPDPTIAAELVMQVRFFYDPSRTRDRSASLLQAIGARINTKGCSYMTKKKKYPRDEPKPWIYRQNRRLRMMYDERADETEQEYARREEIARLKRIYPPRPYMKVTRLRDQYAAYQREKARQAARKRRERTAAKTETDP